MPQHGGETMMPHIQIVTGLVMGIFGIGLIFTGVSRMIPDPDSVVDLRPPFKGLPNDMEPFIKTDLPSWSIVCNEVGEYAVVIWGGMLYYETFDDKPSAQHRLDQFLEHSKHTAEDSEDQPPTDEQAKIERAKDRSKHFHPLNP